MSSAVPLNASFADGRSASVASGLGPMAVVSRFLGNLISAARIDAVIDARQRMVEAKVARYLERQGADRMTDSLERDISRLL